jgi:uncharacterized protein
MSVANVLGPEGQNIINARCEQNAEIGSRDRAGPGPSPHCRPAPIEEVGQYWTTIGENGCGMAQTIHKEQVIATLRAHERELKEAGVVRVHVFGSVARGDADEASDVDLLAQFDDAKPISLIGLVHIENRLSDLLGRKVDLVQERSLKARIRANVEREAVLAF